MSKRAGTDAVCELLGLTPAVQCGKKMCSCVILFQRIVGRLVCPSAELEYDGKEAEDIGTGVLQPGFVLSGQGPSGIN